jgi:dihydroorotate dehydrogenase electron transfer subunit
MQTQVTIVQKETIAPAWWRLTVAAPELRPSPLPGQFLLVRCADRFTCYLRRPIFPISSENDHFKLLLRPDPDPGLAWLATRMPGDVLDVLGPLGTGFPLDKNRRHLLLVSDSPAIGPLLGQMERAIAAGMAVTLALGGSRAAAVYPVAGLPPEVEFQAATLDGSLGYRGPITDLLSELLRWADAACAVGSTALYRTLRQQMEQVRLRAEPKFLYSLVAEHLLVCGVGACLSCAIDTKMGVKLSCVDGPVFDLTELTFNDRTSA